MLTMPSSVRVYLAPGRTDMRKSFDTLAALARDVLEKDPLSGHLFAFCGKRRNRVKILGWDRNGFWLLLKRLEEDRFIWPSEAAVPTLTVEQLRWLLEGIDIGVVQRHPQRVYERAG